MTSPFLGWKALWLLRFLRISGHVKKSQNIWSSLIVLREEAKDWMGEFLQNLKQEEDGQEEDYSITPPEILKEFYEKLNNPNWKLVHENQQNLMLC